jgi:hypothetical protein
MDLERVITFVNEINQYFFKLLLFVGFKLVKMKPKGKNGKHNRLMLCMMKEDFEELMKKNYKKVLRNNFYNSFLVNAYRENIRTTNTDI